MATTSVLAGQGTLTSSWDAAFTAIAVVSTRASSRAHGPAPRSPRPSGLRGAGGRRGQTVVWAATGGVARASVTTERVPAVDSPPVAAVAGDALPLRCGGLSAVPSRVAVDLRSASAGRRHRRSSGGRAADFLPAFPLTVMHSLNPLFSRVDSGRRTAPPVRLSCQEFFFQSRRALARSTLLKQRCFEVRFVGPRILMPFTDSLSRKPMIAESKKVLRLPIVGPATAEWSAEKRSGDCRYRSGNIYARLFDRSSSQPGALPVLSNREPAFPRPLD